MAKSKREKKVEVKEVTEITQEVVKETHTSMNLIGVQTVVGSKLGTLTEGKEYKVPADTAMILINKGFAYLKNK